MWVRSSGINSAPGGRIGAAVAKIVQAEVVRSGCRTRDGIASLERNPVGVALMTGIRTVFVDLSSPDSRHRGVSKRSFSQLAVR